MAMSEASIKRAHIGAGGKEEELQVPADIINSVDTAQLNKVWCLVCCVLNRITVCVFSPAVDRRKEKLQVSAGVTNSATPAGPASRCLLQQMRPLWLFICCTCPLLLIL